MAADRGRLNQRLAFGLRVAARPIVVVFRKTMLSRQGSIWRDAFAYLVTTILDVR
jgi:hypothetical protein